MWIHLMVANAWLKFDETEKVYGTGEQGLTIRGIKSHDRIHVGDATTDAAI